MNPTKMQSSVLTMNPSTMPSNIPTVNPTTMPSNMPTVNPTKMPSIAPTVDPTPNCPNGDEATRIPLLFDDAEVISANLGGKAGVGPEEIYYQGIGSVNG